jgi:hypothetical protein
MHVNAIFYALFPRSVITVYITGHLHIFILPRKCSSTGGIASRVIIEVCDLKYITFLIDGVCPASLNTFRKFVLVIHVSEVAAVRMWMQQECHIAGAHNITVPEK